MSEFNAWYQQQQNGGDEETGGLLGGFNSSFNSGLAEVQSRMPTIPSLKDSSPPVLFGLDYATRFKLFVCCLFLSGLFFALGFLIGLPVLALRPQVRSGAEDEGGAKDGWEERSDNKNYIQPYFKRITFQLLASLPAHTAHQHNSPPSFHSFASLLLARSFPLAPSRSLSQKFALCFTFGSLTFMASFAMIKGPAAHLQSMLTKERLPFTLVYVTSMIATLYCTFNFGGVSGYFIVLTR